MLILAACMSWVRQRGATPTVFHSGVNTLTETVRKPSLVTRLRDLIAGDSGFTLLETLAVMVIVGLLAAITVPQIAKWREKAYITSMKTDARNVASAVEVFYVEKQRYPTWQEFKGLFGAGDVKLNPDNSVSATYYYTLGGTGVSFIVRSSKTSSAFRYSSNGSPTIVATP